MFDVVGVMTLVVLAVGFAWLALRARGARNVIVRWGGLGLSGLMALICSAALLSSLVGFYKLSRAPYRYTVSDVKVTGTPAQVARGNRFILLCAGCHGRAEKPPLVGQNFGEGGPPLGTLYASNLTPAGEIKDWSDGEIIRAIREGVHRSGRPLIIMPAEIFHNLSDADAQALVASLRAQPAVPPASPPTKLNALAAIFVGVGMFNTSAQPPITTSIVAPAEGASAEYGKYLVSVSGCRACHGADLKGGKAGLGPPPGPDLTLLVPQWSESDFIHTLRTGVDPYQHTLGKGMPWKAFSDFASDDDLRGMYAYLHGLSPVAAPSKP